MAAVRESGYVEDERCTCDCEPTRESAFYQRDRNMYHLKDDDLDSYVDPFLLAEEKNIWINKDPECSVYPRGGLNELRLSE
jgi:hypothetical protein